MTKPKCCSYVRPKSGTDSLAPCSAFAMHPEACPICHGDACGRHLQAIAKSRIKPETYCRRNHLHGAAAPNHDKENCGVCSADKGSDNG